MESIEPFTLVVVDWSEENRLFEFVWDGQQRFFKELEWQPIIWSSSTLYTDHMKEMRQDWFREWFIGKSITPEAILDFHKHGGIGFPEVDVFMKREKVGTVSITQVSKIDKNIEMRYLPVS